MADTIEISVTNNENSYILIVKDNGIGISEENLIHIWTPFYTGKPTRAGIGLAICEKIIKNHNCKCRVTSTPGNFTEFEIEFPVSISESMYNQHPDSKILDQNFSASILIVDDEEYLRDLMKEILLNDFNFKIFSCSNGKEAITVLQNNSIDLVISDIRMPEVSGIDLYRYLQSSGMGKKAIMVTADPYSEDIAAFLSTTNLPYLKKPFELMQFKQIVIEKLSNGGKNV